MSDKYFTVGTEGGGGSAPCAHPSATPTPGQALTGAWRVRLSMTIHDYLLAQMTIRLTGQ